MKQIMWAAIAAACVVAPAAGAGSLDRVVEPALMMKLDFGGAARSGPSFALRLNYSSAVRQTLARMAASPDTRLQMLALSGNSRLLDGPALAQFDFNRQGFHSASLAGLPLVTRVVRLNQNADAPAADAPPADTPPADSAAAPVDAATPATIDAGAGAAAAAEPASWYDWHAWDWKTWTAVGVGAAAIIYVATKKKKDDPAPPPSGGGAPPPANCIDVVLGCI